MNMSPSTNPNIELSEQEILAARLWWRTFPDANKGQFSIWKILALYGRHCEEKAMRVVAVALSEKDVAFRYDHGQGTAHVESCGETRDPATSCS